MEMPITTPSLLFPAISLLLLAYTNRFLTLTGVIRQLSGIPRVKRSDIYHRQVENFRVRLKIIRMMQATGVLSFVLCTLSMFALFLRWQFAGQILFGASLVFLLISLLCSLYEVHISTKAIDLEIGHMLDKHESSAPRSPG
ncbi:MAG: DUF2721 domain-containing protein [Cellvibrionaceae bacterium]|nr:DUF2721 domain-containing protein [Cellvibrionaceae bacterium]